MVKIQEFGTFSVACLEPQIYKDLSSHLELCALEYHDFGAMEHAFIIQKWPSDQIFHMEYVLLDTHFSWPHGARTFDQLLLVAHFFWLSSYRQYCSSDWKQSTLNVPATYVYCKDSCQRFHFPWRADRLGVLIRSCSKPFLHCQIINSPKKTHWT